MTQPDPTVPIRIPIGRNVTYAVRGVPEIADEYNAERTIAPTEISLTYRAAEDSRLGRVHAYVKGWWMQDGQRVPMDKPVGRHMYGDPEAWPAWLAEEARLHDPDAPAAVLPASVDRADVLREAADLVGRKPLPEDYSSEFADGVTWATAELRRVAAETPNTIVEVVHGCPPDGSGLTPCCGRTPFELPRGDRISSEAPITCPGPDESAS